MIDTLENEENTSFVANRPTLVHCSPPPALKSDGSTEELFKKLSFSSSNLTTDTSEGSSLCEDEQMDTEEKVMMDHETAAGSSELEKQSLEEEEARDEFVKVFLRIRPNPEPQLGRGKRRRKGQAPQEATECSEEENETVVMMDEKTVKALPPDGSQASRNLEQNQHLQYTFSKIFEKTSQQSELFDATCEHLVKGLLEGKDGLLFAYGVTNAGKTYTVEGTDKQPGILPLALKRLFQLIEEEAKTQAASKRSNSTDSSNSGTSYLSSETETKQSGCELGSSIYEVKVSYLQVYNEQVHDLQVLSENNQRGYNKAKVQVKIRGNRVVVDGLTLTEIKSAKDGMRILKKGRKQRTTHETHLNLSSSRSHSVFSIHMQNHLTKVESKLCIVDLAGTERTKRTNPTRLRQQEASSINSSLMNLMTCLDTIRHNQRLRRTKGNTSAKMVPFRLSKLTLLFRDVFLRSNASGVAMIVNCSTMKDDFDETLHALKYGAIVREVRLKKADEPGEGEGSDETACGRKTEISYDQNGRLVMSAIKPSKGEKSVAKGVSTKKCHPLAKQLHTNLEKYHRMSVARVADENGYREFDDYLDNLEDDGLKNLSVREIIELCQERAAEGFMEWHDKQLENLREQYERERRYLQETHEQALQTTRTIVRKGMYDNPSIQILPKEEITNLKNRVLETEQEALCLRKENKRLKQELEASQVSPACAEPAKESESAVLNQQLEKDAADLRQLLLQKDEQLVELRGLVEATMQSEAEVKLALENEREGTEKARKDYDEARTEVTLLTKNLRLLQAEKQLLASQKKAKRKSATYNFAPEPLETQGPLGSKKPKVDKMQHLQQDATLERTSVLSHVSETHGMGRPKKGLLSRVYDKLVPSKQMPPQLTGSLAHPTPVARRTRARKRSKDVSAVI